MIAYSTQYQEDEDVDVLDQEMNKLVVLNDNFNTFDHVIMTLMRVCGHTSVQAEQCAWIVHTKGKCSVKEGTREALQPLLEAIHDAGIGAEIQ